ncbi:MAG TPA: 50S ribosomal protein L24 [archaeon]|nr:50S ribosomal protein L24 [archaeon]
MTTTRPSKQRKKLFQAKLHTKQRLISVHLSKELRKQMGRRSLPARKGDEVKIMRGRFSGTVGKISKVDLKGLRVYVDNAKRKKVSGQELEVPLHPSNLLLVGPKIEDAKRRKALQRVKKS